MVAILPKNWLREFRDMNELLRSHDLTVVLPGLPSLIKTNPSIGQFGVGSALQHYGGSSGYKVP